MLGYDAGYTAVGIGQAIYNFGKPLGTGTMVLLDNFQCDGTETNLLDCQHTSIFDASTCSHQKDASVLCLLNGKEIKEAMI